MNMIKEDIEAIVREVLDEQLESILLKAVERSMLALPEVVGRLLDEKATMRKLATKFYGDNADFKSHKNIVSSVLSQCETDNPGLTYTDVLKKAKPEIKRRIAQVGKVNVDRVDKPTDLTFNKVGSSDNGML